MPHYERGVYEPTDEVRVFDGSDDDEDVEGSRLPLLIVLALLVLAMFAGVVWLAYTQGVARGRTETPVIAAASGPARVAPQNPGGAQQPYQGFKIYEQPAPPDDDTAASKAPTAPTTTATATPAPAAAPPPPVKLAAAEPKPAPPPAKVAPATAAPLAPAPVKPAPVTAKPVATPPPAAKPVIAEATPKPAAQTAPADKPAPVVIGPATAPPRALGAVATPNPKTVAAAKPAPATPKVAAATPAPATSKPVAFPSGSYVLQIGAYKSQADADAAWKAYKAKHAALLAGYNSDVQQADLGDKGTWYRLRIAGLSDKEVASALCDRLKADNGSCFLGK